MDTGWGTTYLPNWIWAVELSLITGLPVAIGPAIFFEVEKEEANHVTYQLLQKS